MREIREYNMNGTIILGVDNGYGNVKTAHRVSYTFPATAKGTITYTATGYEGTYDGKAHSITVNVTDPAGATVIYSTDAGDNKTYSATNPTFTDAGEYTVYYKIEKENYTVVTGSKVVKINKQATTDNPGDTEDNADNSDTEGGNSDNQTTEGDKVNSPGTGDNSHIHLWFMLLIGSGVAIFIFGKKRKLVSNE